ncbi:MAG: hypothetical protein WDZ48_07015, partial [Pirellulales bacterium]
TGRSRRAASLEIVGQSDPLFKNVSLSIGYDSQQVLTAEDGYGENRFRIELIDQGMRRMPANRSAYNIPSINYAGVYGGLVVVSLGTRLIAVDTLRGGDSSANRILWSEDLNDQIGGLVPMQSIVPRPVNVKWGPPRYIAEDAFTRRYGTMGPVTTDGVCFQRLHDLCCVDPLSGKSIWTRGNVDVGLDLFGDEEYLFAAPAGEGDTLVLRATTGQLLGKRRIPIVESRMATLGRQVLTWQDVDGHFVMEMRDVWLDKALWSYAFAAGSKADLISSDVVGVCQPDGEFSLVKLADGKLLVKEQLEKENSLVGIYLLPSDGGYLLVVHGTARNISNVTTQSFPNPNVPDCPLISGHIYAFDRASGKKLWPAPVPVTQHGLLLSQPRDLPALVLVRQVHRSAASSSRDPKLSVMCIDKRSGKIVYQRDDLPGTTVPICDLFGDPRAHTITISLPTRLITLKYTNDPAKPQAALGVPIRRDAVSFVVGLQDAIAR